VRPPAELRTVKKWRAGGIVLVVSEKAGDAPTPWTAPMTTTGWALTLAQCGGYRRRVDGIEHIVDANTGYLRGPGQDVSTATSDTRRERYTYLELEPPFLHELPGLSACRRPLAVEPRMAFAHRMLLRSLEGWPDRLEVESAVVTMLDQ
jgi:hypothetical protein